MTPHTMHQKVLQLLQQLLPYAAGLLTECLLLMQHLLLHTSNCEYAFHAFCIVHELLWS